MLDTRLLGFREYFLEIDRATAYFGHLAILFHVLDVYQAETSRKAIEVRQGILFPFDRPEQVHFHFHQLRIGIVQDDVIRHLAVFGFELKIMIVIRELDPGFLALLPGSIEGIGRPLPSVRCAHALVDERTNQIRLTDRVRCI